MNFPSIYLASASPRRQILLNQIGVDFSVLSVDVDEQHSNNERPNDYVQRIAVAKAKAGWQSVGRGSRAKKPVLGADTAVIVADKIWGKPKDTAHAKAMLQQLSGRSHRVISAAAIVYKETVLSEITTNTVTFCTLSEADIDWYISTGEGNDKAGGYAVQGLAALFIEQIQGSYSGIMGLPLHQTGLLIQQIVGYME